VTRPRVLLTPDVEERDSRRGSWRAHFIDRAYANAVLAAGGVPVVAPYTTNEEVIAAYLDDVQAVVLTGGAFDVDPALFGEQPHESLGTLKPDRTAFERAIYEGAVARGLPLLGVCGGMQLMCVLRGGTLWQDIGSQTDSAVPHEQDEPKDEAGHDVDVAAGTKLADICGAGALGVNSTHHQAVRALGDGLVASATAADGIVEAFEDPALPFYVAVQWHPEAMPDPRQQAIYRALVHAAQRPRDA
jgi:putative glutamine amidotransferase